MSDDQTFRILGIDVGAVTVSIVEIQDQKVIQSFYDFHKGEIEKTVRAGLAQFSLSTVSGLALTGSVPEIFSASCSYDNRIAGIRAAKQFYPDVRTLLTVGGEKFSLLHFDADGDYLSLRSNTSCAAGTGSFLDQQAGRLKLKDAAELSATSLGNTSVSPKIASRCSVFAKTDIIHAQQEGFSLEEICDGLCQGLANSLVDTLFSTDQIAQPVVFAGGVSLNRAVTVHLEKLLDLKLQIHSHSHLFGAIGSALLLSDQLDSGDTAPFAHGIALKEEGASAAERSYHYKPLELQLTSYPEFKSWDSSEFQPSIPGVRAAVEVDIYRPLEAVEAVVMGIDIGSTSTKAVLIDSSGTPAAGLYTRTAGKPLPAVQSIFEAIDSIQQRFGISFSISQVGTTGSGRKFIGKILGASTILDEITAHAKAAFQLNPEIDTIIEIGGQDAKFTTMRKGVVTFSRMNTVCAAGTGSFIEEQAAKLGIPLKDYSLRAQGQPAPLTSDRCTVFMERDINHYLNKDYSVDEILAAVLFSVRENYLKKVATEGAIGHHVCFQGATARNKALVAAFEAKLEKPVFVSPYCHLTGALGAALVAADDQRSDFKGIDIYKENIEIRSEVCQVCLNHCRIRIATVGETEEAYGFLCGRDYNTQKYVKITKSADIITRRNKLLNGMTQELTLSRRRIQPRVLATIKQIGQNIPILDKLPSLIPQKAVSEQEKTPLTIGLPAGLQLLEEYPLWQQFFRNLGVQLVDSRKSSGILEAGKKILSAECCTPITVFQGHVTALLEHTSTVFLPIYIENLSSRHPDERRAYCYYTQFSSIIASLQEYRNKELIPVMPLINHKSDHKETAREIFEAFDKNGFGYFDFKTVLDAYEMALDFYDSFKRALPLIGAHESGKDSLKVVITGRPYTVLDEQMNKDIPGLFARNNVTSLFQDMIDLEGMDIAEIQDLVSILPWNYAVDILKTALFCARNPGYYPVLITSFKCSPDSMIMEYFRMILDAYSKPYLILQLDEHDSNVGYETRVEAGIRSFKNHLEQDAPVQGRSRSLVDSQPELDGKKVFLPNFDPFVSELLAASFRYHGIDSAPLVETVDSIERSMQLNTGQCIPLNAIAQGYMDAIEKERLNPSNTVLWIPDVEWTCNISVYSHFIDSLVKEQGLIGASVYRGDFTFADIGFTLTTRAFFAYFYGGFLRKIACSIRPYEVNPGETDKVVKQAMRLLIRAFESERELLPVADQVRALFTSIKVDRSVPRPKVAIFGDFYVRDNPVMNQDIEHYIEANGGEVVITPYIEFMKIVVTTYLNRAKEGGRIFDFLKMKSLVTACEIMEKRHLDVLEDLIAPAVHSHKERDYTPFLQNFNVRFSTNGESSDNLLKIGHLMEKHPDLALLVQLNPAFCCPSLVTEAMSGAIEKETGVPIVTITYDGTGSLKNDLVVPYLKYPRKGGAGQRS